MMRLSSGGCAKPACRAGMSSVVGTTPRPAASVVNGVAGRFAPETWTVAGVCAYNPPAIPKRVDATAAFHPEPIPKPPALLFSSASRDSTNSDLVAGFEPNANGSEPTLWTSFRKCAYLLIRGAPLSSFDP